eukprot:2561470-Rhodomonas_salina.1
MSPHELAQAVGCKGREAAKDGGREKANRLTYTGRILKISVRIWRSGIDAACRRTNSAGSRSSA